jgi:hypothetical protein
MWQGFSMEAVRTLLRDRLSAGAIVALVAYTLLLQALFVGLTHGAMAATALQGDVICSTTGPSGPQGGEGSPAAGTDCPFATLCQFAAGTPAGVQPQAALLNPLPESQPTFRPQPSEPAAASLRGLLAEPRAPPVSV